MNETSDKLVVDTSSVNTFEKRLDRHWKEWPSADWLYRAINLESKNK